LTCEANVVCFLKIWWYSCWSRLECVLSTWLHH